MTADLSGRRIPAEQVAHVASSLERVPEVECAYLFGSAARGDAGPLSDVDIAILPAERLPSSARAAWHARLVEQLEREVGAPVDVLLLDDASPTLIHRVLRDGVLLLARDERRRVAFEVRAIREFLDFELFVARYDRALLSRAREGRLGA